MTGISVYNHNHSNVYSLESYRAFIGGETRGTSALAPQEGEEPAYIINSISLPGSENIPPKMPWEKHLDELKKTPQEKNLEEMKMPPWKRELEEIKNPLKAETECQSCEDRTYVDGSDDSAVSFQTPTGIDPRQSAFAVASHEREHVFRAQGKAASEGREVISQSVSIMYDTCSECGTSYASGGVTRTVTKEAAKRAQEAYTWNPQFAPGGNVDLMQ